MTVQDNWLAHLRRLVDEEASLAGGDRRAGYRAVADCAGLSEEYVYQLYEAKPKATGEPREVGKKARNKLERAYARGRPPGWIDIPPPHTTASTSSKSEPPAIPTLPETRGSSEVVVADYAGTPKYVTKVPVVGTAKMGDEGFFEELGYPTGQGDGWVPGFTPDPNAYALRVRGDSMSPAIEDGQFVVIEPNAQPMPGEKVVVALRDGRKMVKRLQFRRSDSVRIKSINSGEERTFMFDEIEFIHPVGSVVEPSRWKPD